MRTARLLTVSRRGGVSASGPREVSASGPGDVWLWSGGVCLWSWGCQPLVLRVSVSGLGRCLPLVWEGAPPRPEVEPLPLGRHPLADTPLPNACWDTYPRPVHAGYIPPPSACGIHTPPVDRQTPVKTLPSQTMFVFGNNVFTLTTPVYYLVFDDTYSQLEFLNNNGCGNRDGVAPGVIPAGSRCEILPWILLRRRYGGYHHFHLIGICRPFVCVRLKESGRGGSKIFWDRGGANMLLGHSFFRKRHKNKGNWTGGGGRWCPSLPWIHHTMSTSESCGLFQHFSQMYFHWMKIKLKRVLYISFGYVAGSSLMKIVYRSKKDFCNGQPLHRGKKCAAFPFFVTQTRINLLSAHKFLVQHFQQFGKRVTLKRSVPKK